MKTGTPKVYCSNLKDFLLGLKHHYHFYPHTGYNIKQFINEVILYNDETEELFQIVNKLNLEEKFVLSLRHKERYK